MLHGCSLVFKLHDGGPELVREVLLERGWQEYNGAQQEDQDWNLHWRGSSFHSSEYHNLLPWQRLNHHPKTAGITRKDLLARNLRRMRATAGSALYDFSPTAFILPNDYTRFLAEYNKLRPSTGPPAYWICKPVALSRGRGIFLFEDIKDLVYDCSVIVQRYVSSPLLISGYKFDLRIYVCVKSFHPLTIYIHQEGLVRFATEKYDLSSLRNIYAHLTNTSINKLGPFYETRKERVGRGCKWTMSKFRHFLCSQDVNQLLLWQRINNIVTLTLLAIVPSVPCCPNCVELFGFDVLVDGRYKPWLLEVNYSPALTPDCQADFAVKKRLISDLIDVMNYTSADRRRGRRPGDPPHAAVPVLSKVRRHTWQKETSGVQHPQIQALPLLRGPHRSGAIPRRQHAPATDHQRKLPPVGLNNTSAAKGRTVDATGSRNHADRALNVTLNHRTRPAPAPWPTDHAEVELALQMDVCSVMLGLRPSAVSWRPPDIYRGSDGPAREGGAAAKGPPAPPVRVGGFIRTFPFNSVTLKASRHKLDVRTVVHELHKLTAEAASGRSDKTTCTTGEEQGKKDQEGEEDFESLFWGPRDPPLLSQRFKTT